MRDINNMARRNGRLQKMGYEKPSYHLENRICRRCQDCRIGIKQGQKSKKVVH